MTHYRVVFSPEVRDDLAEIRSYVEEHLKSPQAASNLVLTIVECMESLSAHPSRGAPLSSILDLPTDYRFLVCMNYLVFYRLQDDTVYVIRVLHGKRDYMRILFADLLQDKE